MFQWALFRFALFFSLFFSLFFFSFFCCWGGQKNKPQKTVKTINQFALFHANATVKEQRNNKYKLALISWLKIHWFTVRHNNERRRVKIQNAPCHAEIRLKKWNRENNLLAGLFNFLRTKCCNCCLHNKYDIYTVSMDDWQIDFHLIHFSFWFARSLAGLLSIQWTEHDSLRLCVSSNLIKSKSNRKINGKMQSTQNISGPMQMKNDSHF